MMIKWFVFYRSGDLDMSRALTTTNYLSRERDYIPWEAAMTELSFVSSMLARHPLYGSFSVSRVFYNWTELNKINFFFSEFLSL